MISLRYKMQRSNIILLLGLVRTLVADAHHTPLETMADVTNDFGVCVLQIIASPNANTVFSPYGLMSMALLVYEGATGPSSAELYNTLHLPWHRDIVRIGFRDLHRYLRSYFSSEGFLKGLVFSKPNFSLRPSYTEVLKFYGFEPDTSITQPVSTTEASVDNREKEENETTTANIQETTPQVETTLTTAVGTTTDVSEENVNEASTTDRGSITTVLPTSETSIKITTASTEQSTTTELLNMQSPTTQPPTTTQNTDGTLETVEPTVTTTTQNTDGTLETVEPTVTTTTQNTDDTLEPVEPTVITISKTTKREMTGTEQMELLNTRLEMTNKPMSKTTRVAESTTEDITTITENGTTMSDSETITPLTPSITTPIADVDKHTTLFTLPVNTATPPIETTSVGVDMVTQAPPLLESTNTIVYEANNTVNTPPELPVTTLITTETYTESETTDETADVADSEFVTFFTTEDTTKEIISEWPAIDMSSTVLVGTTEPLEEVILLTTPAEVFQGEGSAILDSLTLNRGDRELEQFKDFTLEPTITKRSIGNIEIPDHSIKSNSIHSRITNPHKTAQSQEFSPVGVIGGTPTTTDTLGNASTDNLTNSKNSIAPLLFDYLKSFIAYNRTEHPNTSTVNGTKVLPNSTTSRLDGSVFTTTTDSRLPRAVKTKEKPEQLGNWVGDAARWHPSPSSQWFWSYSGDKLVPVLTYAAYLPYAELPSLSASAIQLPLDDNRYTLMILLPTSGRGLKQMLHALQRHSLRNIFKSLKPTPVYAVVPAFTVVKHINLTPALYKLGIRNIFDAYLANLYELSPEPNLYVRSVEQVITISVQKYFANHKWFEASPSQVEQHFLAAHPFAYFVIDVETKVSLIAGTMVDPLLRNS